MEHSPFPPRVVLYIQEEISRRTQYKSRLEQTPPYTGYVDFYRKKKESDRLMLETAIKGIYDDVVAVARRHLPSIEISDNPEVTIATILSVLPPPEDVVMKRVYHGGQ